MLAEMNTMTMTKTEPDPMTLESSPYRRIGWWDKRNGQPVIWPPEDWENPITHCVNDLIDLPGTGIGRVTSVQNGLTYEVVRRMMAGGAS